MPTIYGIITNALQQMRAEDVTNKRLQVTIIPTNTDSELTALDEHLTPDATSSDRTVTNFSQKDLDEYQKFFNKVFGKTLQEQGITGVTLTVEPKLEILDHSLFSSETGKVYNFKELYERVTHNFANSGKLNAYSYTVAQCFSGKERSVTYSIAYLIVSQSLTPLQAAKLIKQKRSIVKKFDGLKPEQQFFLFYTYFKNVNDNPIFTVRYLTQELKSDIITNIKLFLKLCRSYQNNPKIQQRFDDSSGFKEQFDALKKEFKKFIQTVENFNPDLHSQICAKITTHEQQILTNVLEFDVSGLATPSGKYRPGFFFGKPHTPPAVVEAQELHCAGQF